MIGLSLILAYVALSVNWIIHHNERIIAALAKYQSRELVQALNAGPAMWEKSYHLHREDNFFHSILTLGTEEAIVLAPPLVTFAFALSKRHVAPWWPAHVWLPSAAFVNLLSLIIGIQMIRTKYRLRKNHSEHRAM